MTEHASSISTVNETSQHKLLAVVARNASFVLGMQVVLKILAFLFNIYIVRRLGDVHFGKYSVVIAYVDMFAIFTDWGMSPYALREMAKDQQQTTWLLPNLVILRLLLSIVIIIIAPLSALWLGKEHDLVIGILIASVGLLIYAFQGPLDSALAARERLDYTSGFALVNQLVFWGLGVLLLVSGAGFSGLIIARLTGVTVVAILSAWALSKMDVKRLVIAPRRWRELFFSALPFGVSTISYAFIRRFDTVYMSFILTAAAIGWYNVPWTLINMTLLIAQSIAIAMYPSMVRSYNENPDTLPRIIWQSLKYLLIVALPIVVGGIVLADRIIITLYEKTFINSIPVLQIMLLAVPIMFLLELLGRVADTLHLERPKAKANIINAIIIVALNLILVPTLGIVGASLALVIGQTTRLIQYWRLIGNERLVNHRWMELLRVALAAAAMGILVFGLCQLQSFAQVDSKIGLFSLIILGGVSYIVGLITFGGIKQKEIAFLRTMVQARSSKGGNK